MTHRTFAAGIAAALLGLAAWRLGAGQGAVSWSLPGQEDLTFWVNHNGLEQIEHDGEVGFGDLARVLMRRRSNAPKMMELRDRFVFRVREFDKLATPDLLRDGARYVVAAGRAFNVPAVRGGKGYLFKVNEPAPGIFERSIDGRKVTLDVRPLVRLRVRTDPPTARVYLTGADGLGYAPKGAVSRFASEPAEQFFHSSGEFEIHLPAGETTIEATRGIEYRLARRTIDLRAPAAVELKLDRWTDSARVGWYSSDAHIHANYTAPHHQVVTPRDVLNYTLGEDLHVPNMMVANSSGAFVHDTAFFEGRPSNLSRPPYLIYWNEEMRNAGVYGHMCLYGLKKLVEPVYTGFRDTPHWEDYPPNYTQAKATQDQGGAVTYAHPGYAPNFDGASMREMPVDAALGVIDAMDVMSNNPEEVAVEMWYRLLNCGVRLGISAGTDSFTNVADHYVPGAHRVYAHVDGPLTYDGWVRAYKRGRTFATNGPMLFLKVEGREPGSEVSLAKPGRVRVEVVARSEAKLDAVELVVNGRAVSPVPASIEVERSSWIAARAKGPWNRMVLNDGYVFAHTSPVWVSVAGAPVVSSADARFWTDWIDKLIDRTAQRGRFADQARKKEVLELFARGREYYARQLDPTTNAPPRR
jgi:hypothetical protein